MRTTLFVTAALLLTTCSNFRLPDFTVIVRPTKRRGLHRLQKGQHHHMDRLRSRRILRTADEKQNKGTHKVYALANNKQCPHRDYTQPQIHPPRHNLPVQNPGPRQKPKSGRRLVGTSHLLRPTRPLAQHAAVRSNPRSHHYTHTSTRTRQRIPRRTRLSPARHRRSNTQAAATHTRHSRVKTTPKTAQNRNRKRAENRPFPMGKGPVSW